MRLSSAGCKHAPHYCMNMMTLPAALVLTELLSAGSFPCLWGGGAISPCPGWAALPAMASDWG